MKLLIPVGLFVGAFIFLLQTAPAYSTEPGEPRMTMLKAKGSGFREVPSVSSTGSARFRGTINPERTEVAYRLSYEAAEGNVFMAHIHIGQFFANGGISVWFCGDPGSPIFPPPGSISVPICDPTAGTLEGVFTAADVLGPAGQGIAAGEFEEFLRALEAGVTYVNIHSDKHIPGEIRAQIRAMRKHKKDD